MAKEAYLYSKRGLFIVLVMLCRSGEVVSLCLAVGLFCYINRPLLPLPYK